MLRTANKGNNLRLKYSCKFPGCTRAYHVDVTGNIKNRHFYKFPRESNKNVLKQWKRVCHIKDDVNCSNFYVCEDHFLEKDFVNHSRHRLNYEVVPKHLELVIYNGCKSVMLVSSDNFVESRTVNLPKLRSVGENIEYDTDEDSCETTEEPHFVKCEPGWQSDGEESCDFPQQRDSSENLKIKIEPDETLANSGVEEVSSEHNTEVMLPAAESSTSGDPSHECDSSSFKTVSETEVIRAKESQAPVISGSEKDKRSALEVNRLNCIDLRRNSSERQRKENQPSSTFTPKGVYSCSKCNKNFKQLRYLKTHIKNHNQQTTHSCSVCGTSFSSVSNLKRHSLTHTDQRPYTCSVCDKAFKDIHSQKKHFRIHTGERPYQCKICFKSFTQIGTLKTHVFTHGSTELSHVCSSCDKAFPTVKKLKRHLVVHIAERPYCCTTCGKSFREKPALKKHAVMHSVDRPFSCDMCFRTFSRKEALKAHIVLHEDDRPYSCTTCGKAFRRRSHLESHILLHYNPSPLMCTICGKMFKLRGALETHMTTHSNRTCPTCGEEFIRLPDFKSHLLTHVEVNIETLADSTRAIEDKVKL